ncbi:SDR family NAD(P)-dependent oxidoreductase [Sporomusa sphaeroides DSM 2875]|uniref:SDR family NAD(P)-dependent oxidoreductase n=1 Tax=Sporomusa sphaeroides TaxID=47679 RepID=UPI00202E3C6B|nr:SDR family NAD(P)-dependent oxidoreductase [Sporomusa sphaeroides]MCM0760827.1 SDR family NAD(P)-dependent oxidoreductase [Sporomusa sphaeroides DSM 2875]
MLLKGKVALVTGGGTGIGKGVVEALAREGARIVIAAADFVESAANQYGSKNIGGYTAAKKLAAELQANGTEAIAVEANITKVADAGQMVKATVERFGRLDILINAAGLITCKQVADLTEADWDAVVDTNAKGTFITNQAVIAQMKQQGGGRIINFSSIAGKTGYPGLAHYCASKFAVIGFTNALAKELVRDNITVNAIAPGIVATEMWVNLRKAWANPGESEEESYQRNVQAMIPQGVDQTPEDMAKAVLFFIDSPHVTGQTLNVDGGCS